MKQYFLISLFLFTPYLCAMENKSLMAIRTMLINSTVPDILPEKRSTETYSLCVNAKSEYVARQKQNKIILTTNSFTPFASEIDMREDIEYMQWHNNLLIVKTPENLHLYNTSKIVLEGQLSGGSSTITSANYDKSTLISSVKDTLALQIDGDIYVNGSQKFAIAHSSDTICVSDTFDEEIKEKTISSLCLHPIDQNILALGTSDGIIFIWNIKEKKIWTTINAIPEAPITSLHYSPDGKYLSALSETKICIVSFLTHEGITTALDKKVHPTLPACWSSDNNYFTVILNNGIGIIWNTSTQQYIQLKDIPAPITAFCWSPDSNYLTLGLQDGTIHIWTPHIKSCIKTLSENGSSIKELHWPQRSQELRAIHKDGTEYRWETKRLPSFEALHCKATSVLLCDKLKKDFTLLAPHAFQLGLLAGTGYGLYYWVTNATAIVQTRNDTIIL